MQSSIQASTNSHMLTPFLLLCILPRPSLQIYIDKGALDLYPFDKYEVNVSVEAYTGSLESYLAGNSPLGINVVPLAYKPYGWDIEFQDPAEVSKDGNAGRGFVEFTVTFRRSGLFKLYPIFMILSLWVIALVTFYVAVKFSLFSPKPVPPPLVAAYVALLFALPAYRKSAPGDPPLGAAASRFILCRSLVLPLSLSFLAITFSLLTLRQTNIGLTILLSISPLSFSHSLSREQVARWISCHSTGLL